jgi:ABC-type lipoprotein export system ATPase subunit
MIELSEVSKIYQVGELDVPVLHGISLKLEKGDYTALMGSSGSGKSTLMNILGCLDRPTTGKYLFEGKEIGNSTRDERAEIRNEKIGFIFQSFQLLPRMSALENVLMPLTYSYHQDIASKESRAFAKELLEKVGLKDRMQHEPSQLSGGQQQRVAIARSLINRPKIIFADEPTGNLDSETTHEVLDMFDVLSKSGITIVIVTHEQDVGARAKKILRMKDGRIL